MVAYVKVGEQTAESGGEGGFDKRQLEEVEEEEEEVEEECESGLDWQVSRENCAVGKKDVRLGEQR